MLVGCSATASAPEPAETPSASAVQSISQRSISDEPLIGALPEDLGVTPEEYAFAFYVNSQAEGAAVEVPTVKESVIALHEFCSSGVPFALYEDETLNVNLADEASALTCEAMANPQR